MISLMNLIADVHFRNRSERTAGLYSVYTPGKCYFIDSKADEEKARAFVNLYRIPNTVISLLLCPIVMVPALILEDYGGLTPRAHSSDHRPNQRVCFTSIVEIRR